MTNITPAKTSARPRSNAFVNWAPPTNTSGPNDSGNLPLLSPRHFVVGKHTREKKDGPGCGNLQDGQQQHDPSANISITPHPFDTQYADSRGNTSSNMLTELRKIIKEEVALAAQAAQFAQLKNTEAVSPVETQRVSPFSAQDSFFAPSKSTAPASVVTEALDSSHSEVSSLSEPSPEIARADLTSTPSLASPPTSILSPPPTLVSQITQPISPLQKAVRFRSRGPPVVNFQQRIEPEMVSPTATVPQLQSVLNSVDKAWGVLFDSHGYPTQRLNSVLRGLANFMITEFGPPEPLVITPEKMLVLYTKYKVDLEKFQYEAIFRSHSKDALERIEFLYQDLDCQYHLIQGTPRSHPSVPALTPIGFAKWMVSNILAYPDAEAQRLHAIMSELPINVDGPLVDGRAERLPKKLSRRLFPDSHDRKVRKILDEAICDCLEDATPPLPSIPRPRPGPSSDNARLTTDLKSNSRRPSAVEERKRPGPLPYRSRTHHDRGYLRIEPYPARLPRTNSDGLPPPPMGRHSVPQQRQRSPPLINHCSASLPAIPQLQQHHSGGSLFTPSAQSTALLSEARGSDSNYNVFSGRESSKTYELRDESPSSPGGRAGRRGANLGGSSDKGPTWEEICARSKSSSKTTVDEETQRSSR